MRRMHGVSGVVPRWAILCAASDREEQGQRSHAGRAEHAAAQQRLRLPSPTGDPVTFDQAGRPYWDFPENLLHPGGPEHVLFYNT